MSEQQNTPPSPGNGDGGTGQGDPGQQQQAQSGYFPSKKEWADYRREQRSFFDSMKAMFTQQGEQAKTDQQGKGKASEAGKTSDEVAAKALARADELEFKLNLRDALDAAGVTDAKARKLVEAAARSDRPSDLAEFVAGFADVLPKKAAQVIEQPKPEQAKPEAAKTGGPSNSGPPASSGGSSGEDDPRKWKPEIVKAMDPVAFKKALDDYLSTRTGRNPYKGLKRPHER